MVDTWQKSSMKAEHVQVIIRIQEASSLKVGEQFVETFNKLLI